MSTRKRRKQRHAQSGKSKQTRKTSAAKTPKRRSLLWRLLRWPVRLVFLLMILSTIWVVSYRVINPPGGIYMASEAWRLSGVRRDWQYLDQISPRLVRAVIAAEDANFCDHNGFDFDAIQAAIETNRQGRRVVGASTITQQVAKNVFLWHERSWVRKGLEVGFTGLIELTWPKRRIVEVYLNTVEFDEGVFGADAAAWHYFGRPALALTPVQSARLAAVLPSPKRRSASKPSNSVRRRANAIAAGARTIQAEGRAACVFE